MSTTQAVKDPRQDPKRPRYFFTPEELAQFHERGVSGPHKLFEQDEMKEIWKRQRLRLMDRSHAAYPADTLSGNTNLANYDRHIDSDFLADLVCHPHIVDKMISILGPDVICWRSEFFSKYPGEEGTDWHQADTFAMASGHPQIIWPGHVRDSVTKSPFGGTITVWIATTDTDEESGCLQFIPGTHKTMYYDETGGMQYDTGRIGAIEKGGVRRGFWGYDYRQLQIDPNWEPDESQAISVPCKAGEYIIFWSQTMHASTPHLGKTNDYRMAFALRYVPASVRVYPDTDMLTEYGAQISLEKFGVVVAAGKHDPSTGNRVITQTTRGKPFFTADPR